MAIIDSKLHEVAAKDPKNKLRFATIHTGPKGKAPELTVSALQGAQAGSPPANVRRWRVQLGLKDNLGELDLEDFYRDETVGGLPAIVVDMIGPGSAEKMRPMEEPGPAGPAFKFEAPKGWKEVPPNQFSSLSFLIVEKDKKAIVTVSELQGDGGGLLENVNRWRKQVGLGPIDATQADALPEIVIDSLKAKLVDVTGTGPNVPPERNRILGAVLLRANQAVFFKLTGPRDFVGQQQSAFETFLKSIRFGG